MRAVSRTRRVAFEWLFDRINLDPKIQIKYTDTKHQLADILTKGNFTRDEWNNLLRFFFNIRSFSSESCPQTMSKSVQEGAGEEIVTAKSKPMMNLVSKIVGKSSMSLSSSASNSAVGTQSTKSKCGSYCAECRETCTNRFERGRSIEFSSVAIRCKSELKCRETCTHGKDSESH